jgi:hypothetical protein
VWSRHLLGIQWKNYSFSHPQLWWYTLSSGRRKAKNSDSAPSAPTSELPPSWLLEVLLFLLLSTWGDTLTEQAGSFLCLASPRVTAVGPRLLFDMLYLSTQISRIKGKGQRGMCPGVAPRAGRPSPPSWTMLSTNVLISLLLKMYVVKKLLLP